MGVVREDLNSVPTQEAILKALARIRDPDLGRDIVALGFIKDLEVSGENVSFSIELTTPACPVRDQMKEQAYRAVLSLPGVRKVDVTMTSQVRSTRSDEKDRLLPLVKNIIPIASGKGGVGKSTVSANMAVALSKLGARVGLMDADVYGPTIPTLMGADGPLTQQDGKIIPAFRYGVKIVSMGFLVPKGEAVIWRGPMLAKMVDQFLGGVDWGELDYLIIDLPPGTGDIQLSLCQKIPLTGVAIVSTPQDVAFKVAEKAIFMFNKLRTPVLGLVENMSGFECRHCGHREDIFGSGGAQRYGMANNIPFLGAIPLSTDIRVTSDAGRPIVESASDSPSALAFMRVAENLAAQVSTHNIAGMVGDRPEPAEITQPSKTEVRIVWKDGHESLYPGRALRAACSCAGCVDELSGSKRLHEAFLPQDIYPLAIEPVGRYAIRFRWSDGHSTGIYTFEHLRELCPCPICAGKERTEQEPATPPQRVAERLPVERAGSVR
jgi:ATP-binding protein involved in chromosome partitioning